MKKYKLSILDRFSHRASVHLKSNPHLEVSNDHRENVEIIVIRTKVKVDRNFLNQHPNLKFVVTATSGFDHIDVHEARVRGIQVAYCPEGNVHSAAELTILLALALARRFGEATAMAKSGNWDRDRILGKEIYSKTQ